jgi:hypothetical protein
VRITATVVKKLALFRNEFRILLRKWSIVNESTTFEYHRVSSCGDEWSAHWLEIRYRPTQHFQCRLRLVFGCEMAGSIDCQVAQVIERSDVAGDYVVDAPDPSRSIDELAVVLPVVHGIEPLLDADRAILHVELTSVPQHTNVIEQRRHIRLDRALDVVVQRSTSGLIACDESKVAVACRSIDNVQRLQGLQLRHVARFQCLVVRCIERPDVVAIKVATDMQNVVLQHLARVRVASKQWIGLATHDIAFASIRDARRLCQLELVNVRHGMRLDVFDRPLHHWIHQTIANHCAFESQLSRSWCQLRIGIGASDLAVHLQDLGSQQRNVLA